MIWLIMSLVVMYLYAGITAAVMSYHIDNLKGSCGCPHVDAAIDWYIRIYFLFLWPVFVPIGLYVIVKERREDREADGSDQ